ncbi:DUF4382 domain-containing protein [Halorubellus litoreus]|uniref:DUF4382 domain-containing protein n=1 Tax=Halorubellus litoreus TaxID=755308 RepID=A0ABD5VB22_9EURY
MRRRTLLGATAVSTVAALGGCLSSITGASTGTLATHVSDRPGDIEDFESCVVTVTELDVMPADADESETLDVEEGSVDLTEVKGEKSELVDRSDLETGEYDWLRVTIDGDVDATLADGGGDATVKVPSNGLKLNKAFEVREGTTTNFTADFTPVKRGQGSTYNIQPVTQEVTVTYEDDESTSGTAANESTSGTAANETSA